MSELTITEQLAKILFLPETIEKVKNQFQSGLEIQPLEKFDMSLRLITVGNNINLELLVSVSFGYYHKPIGFYDSQLNIYILREFEPDLVKLKTKAEIPKNLSIKTLSLRKNAVIAAFSMDVIEVVIPVLNEVQQKGFKSEFKNGAIVPGVLRYDRSLIVNGLKSELIMTFEGYPQFNLDDEYGLEGAIGSYRFSGRMLRTNPIVEYKKLYDELTQMRLLSAYNRIK